MAARIEVIQWREFGDDEDSLDLVTFADGDKTDVAQLIADERELANGDEAPDGPGKMLVTCQHAIEHGQEIRTHDGRVFVVSLVETEESRVRKLLEDKFPWLQHCGRGSERRRHG